MQGKRAKAAARPKTYALHEDEDGWEGIQEAQNAAATFALFQVQLAKSKIAASVVSQAQQVLLHPLSASRCLLQCRNCDACCLFPA